MIKYDITTHTIEGSVDEVRSFIGRPIATGKTIKKHGTRWFRCGNCAKRSHTLKAMQKHRAGHK